MIRTDITKTISQFIENQFPGLYQEEGQVLIAFLTAYYEYLEQSGDLLNREMFTIRDIDTTFDEFLVYFRKKYIEGFPFLTSTDTRFLIKNVTDFYKAKGSDESVKLLMKLIFNDESDVYYPSTDILRASDSLWIDPIYLEVSFSSRTKTYLNKTIIGSTSGATAFVESIVTKKVAGKIIDILYLSNLRGNFATGEFISDDSIIKNAPKIIGSLSELDVDLGGSGYKIGDRLNVVSPEGKNAIARVTEVLSKTDAAEFTLVDGGFGYTLDSDTQVYVSTAMLFCDNENLEFKDFETVTQTLEKLTIDTANTELSVGDSVSGFDSLSDLVGEGRIVKIEPDKLTIEVDEGTFARTFFLDLEDPNRFFPTEEIEEENTVELQFENSTGSFINGESLLQRDIEGEISINVAVGTLDLVDGTILYVNEAFGDFLVGKTIEGLTSGSTATITNVSITSQGNRGKIIESSNSSIIVLPSTGDFSANTKIRGVRSKNINNVLSVFTTGLERIEVANTSINVSAYENVSASGFVVGQAQERVGLFGNTSPFVFTSETTNFIRSSETNLQKELTRVGFGSGANFEVGSLVPDTEETFIYNRDIIDSENVVGINYLDIFVDGVGSNVSRVSNIVDVIDGGSGYSNTSTVEFSGGGYLGGEPLISAVASVITDEFGEITNLVIEDGGQGYFEVPTITISDGVGANIELVIDYGYGFPDNPYGGFEDVLETVWTERELTLGEIFSLQKINNGANYDAGVFTKVINGTIRKFNLYDLEVSLSNELGTFAIGEVVQSTSGYRARVKNLVNGTSILKPLSFVNQLQVNETLTGLTSGSTATVSSINEIQTSLRMGENAQIDSLVVLADGIIVRVEIIDSGFGYKEGNTVQLFDARTDDFATTATSKLIRQGKSLGFWQTTTSQLNDKKLRDNFFYQEYSYQVIASFSFDRYEKILRDLVHVSGAELFGAVKKKTSANVVYDNSVYIAKGTSTTESELISSLNIMDVPFTDINLDPPDNSGVGRINTFIGVLNGGSGYSNTSIIEFIGGGGESGLDDPITKAQGFIVTDNSGSIISVGVTNRGEGYTEVPTFTISGGIGADLDITIDYGYGFVKNPYSTIQSVLNQTLGGDAEKIFAETETIYETQK
jgi:hypothetical protein